MKSHVCFRQTYIPLCSGWRGGYHCRAYSYDHILAVTCMSMQQLVWVIAVIAALHCTEHLMYENVYFYLEWRK
jgi:hypothetical protein